MPGWGRNGQTIDHHNQGITRMAKPGRPAKPVEQPAPSAIIEVWDERLYLADTPKRIATHENVPGDWTTNTIVERFGIGEHLTLYRSSRDEPRHIIHGSHR